MNPIKILYITHYSEFMGANRALFELVCRLRDSGKVSPLVIVPGEGEFQENLASAGIQTMVFRSWGNIYVPGNILRRPLQIARLILSQLRNQIQVRRLARKLRDKGFQLVHSNSSATNFGAQLARRLSIPHIWHFRENLRGHYHAEFLGGYDRQLRYFDRHSDKILGISNYIVSTFKPLMSPDKVCLVYDGLPEVEVPDTRAKQETSDILRICTVGLLHPSKQQHIVLEAVRQTVSSGIRNIKLYIVGRIHPNDAYYLSLKGFVETNGLAPYVEFSGYQADAAKFIAGMDIGVLASKDEAFGRVTIEYMQAGLIPIGLNSGANPELINNGENGFIFNSTEELSNILSQMAIDPNMRLSIQSRAIQSANSFPLSATVDKVYEQYLTILQSQGYEDYRRNRLL